MTYELAKQLKDAGFPQRHINTCDECDDKLPECKIAEYNRAKGPYEPSPSELITVFRGMVLKLWILKDGRAGIQLEGESLDDVFYWETLEEALVKLYLLRNKKTM